VRIHPDGPVFVGDRLSFEVIAPDPGPAQGSDAPADAPPENARITLQSDPVLSLGESPFALYGIGSRQQATFYWPWDTAGLQPGEYSLEFSILPEGPSWIETVSLLPAEQLPPPQPDASWQTATVECCVINYISGTAAGRDLEALLAMADEQYRRVSGHMGQSLDEPAQLTFIPRVLGHGGFAGQEISVSYLDRNYAGRGTDIVVHHELVHLLDSHRTTGYRPSMLVEGLAVYLSGGHFKPEPLLPRAAALLPARPGCSPASTTGGLPSDGSGVCSLDWYIPLAPLADDFYHAQHEIGYLQAGALVAYMIQTWGWEAFDDFYTHIESPQPAGEGSQEQPWTQSQVIDAALQEHLGVTLLDLEAGFRQALEQVPLTGELVQDVRLSVAYYDAMRRYQLALDPSAHFLAAWLPDAGQMRSQDIVADFLRHPAALENIALEAMLVEADAALRASTPDYPRAEGLLLSVNQVLDAIDSGATAFQVSPLAADYLAVARAASQAGYQAQRISLDDNTARVVAALPGKADAGQDAGPQLVDLIFRRTRAGWTLLLQETGLMDTQTQRTQWAH
jgi:hypothetical protein